MWQAESVAGKNTIKCIRLEKLLGKINTHMRVGVLAAHNWIKIYTLRPGAIIPANVDAEGPNGEQGAEAGSYFA